MTISTIITNLLKDHTINSNTIGIRLLYYIVSWRFTILLLGESGRQLVKAPLAAIAIIFDLAHPFNPSPMREMIDETRDRPRHWELRSLLFSTSTWAL